MSSFPMRPLTVSQKRIAARLRKQHEGKVLCAHRRSDGCIDVFLSDYLRHHRRREPRLLSVVDRGRIVAMKIDGNLALVCSRGGLDNRPHPALDQIKRLDCEWWHRTAEP